MSFLPTGETGSFKWSGMFIEFGDSFLAQISGSDAQITSQTPMGYLKQIGFEYPFAFPSELTLQGLESFQPMNLFQGQQGQQNQQQPQTTPGPVTFDCATGKCSDGSEPRFSDSIRKFLQCTFASEAERNQTMCDKSLDEPGRVLQSDGPDVLGQGDDLFGLRSLIYGEGDKLKRQAAIFFIAVPVVLIGLYFALKG